LGAPSDPESVLARFDRTTPDTLLASIAAEIVRLQEEHRLLAARLAAVEVVQAAADRLLPSQGPMDLPEAVHIDAGFPLAASDGFHEVELDTAGAPFRWTGPARHFSLEFSIDRSLPAIFRLRFDGLATPAPADAILAFVDGLPVAIEVGSAGAGNELSGPVPSRVGGRNAVLTVVCPAVSLSTEDVPRRLGMSFRSLTVERPSAARAAAPDEGKRPGRRARSSSAQRGSA